MSSGWEVRTRASQNQYLLYSIGLGYTSKSPLRKSKAVACLSAGAVLLGSSCRNPPVSGKWGK